MGRLDRRGDAHRAAARAGDTRFGRVARGRDPVHGRCRSPRRTRVEVLNSEVDERRPMSTASTPTPPRERTVADVMSRPVVTAQPAETVAVAAQRMADGKVGSVVVIDHDDRAIGILTERDMIRLAAAGSDASTAKVSEWMTADPDTIGPELEARRAFATLSEHGYRHIPVVESSDAGLGTGQKLVGIVS